MTVTRAHEPGAARRSRSLSTRSLPSVPPYPGSGSDVARALTRFTRLATTFGPSSVHYRVAARPQPQLIFSLTQAGARFAVSSPGELALVLAAGAEPRDLLYTDPVMPRRDIDHAVRAGVRLFVAHSGDELAGLAAAAPGCAVLVRLTAVGARAGRADTCGCRVEEAAALLLEAAGSGLQPAGLALRVGGRADPGVWGAAVDQAAAVFAAVRGRGLSPWLLDLGDAVPADDGDRDELSAYRAAFTAALDRGFDKVAPQLLLEPGRGIVGRAALP